MIEVKSLFKVLHNNKCNFFSGVPDSVLKEFSNYLETKNKKSHIIASNEGAAVSIGIGHFLSTNKIPCIYMQNSGLSNAINPLISLAHKNVYKIPLILIIGWRGSPKIKDEPQHNVKGKITTKILNLLNIKYQIVRKETDLIKFDKKVKSAKKNSEIVACLIEKGTIRNTNLKNKNKLNQNFTKEEFLNTFLELIDKNSKIISSTGYNSRHLMSYEKNFKFLRKNSFYLVGGMGHTSSVALGYSLKKKKKVICLDGDGSMLMHLGSLNTTTKFINKNFKYILINNNIHDSVGGQKTYSDNINLFQFSKSIGFKKYICIKSKTNLKKKIKKFLNNQNYNFLEVKVSKNKQKNLPRPKDLISIKNKFMK